jgi:hypothetical protein
MQRVVRCEDASGVHEFLRFSMSTGEIRGLINEAFNFRPADGHVSGSRDSQPDALSLDGQDGDADAAIDNQFFIGTASEDQHAIPFDEGLSATSGNSKSCAACLIPFLQNRFRIQHIGTNPVLQKASDDSIQRMSFAANPVKTREIPLRG